MADRHTHNHNYSFGYLVGAACAAALSYTTFHSVGYAVVAAFFGWLYVIYYFICYGLN